MYMCVYCIYIVRVSTVLGVGSSGQRSIGSLIAMCRTPSPPTKSFDFRGFDSSMGILMSV